MGILIILFAFITSRWYLLTIAWFGGVFGFALTRNRRRPFLSGLSAGVFWGSTAAFAMLIILEFAFGFGP